MAKGPIVTSGIETLIASIYQQHPKWKAPRVRNEVEGILHKKKPNSPKGWPSLSTVQKILATIRKNIAKPNPKDEPWSMAEIDRYSELGIEVPIPEALLIVLNIWKSRVRKGDTLTIREAKWIARLSALEQDTERLSSVASHYARTELIFELIGHPFNSMELDRSLMGLPVALSDFKSFLFLLAGTQEDTERGIKDGVDQVKEMIKEKQKRGKSK
jgi:hypothetical protein